MIFITIVALIFLAYSSDAALSDDMSGSLNTIGEGIARYLVADEDGGLQMVFNSSSLVYAAVILIPIAIVALVALPMLGFNLENIFKRTFARDEELYAYEGQDYTVYTDAQRSVELLHPILGAISDAYNKYL